MAVYDVIVVGAGIIGLSAAHALQTNKGARVLLLEQFPFLHGRGSSHGHSRIFRQAYPTSQDYYGHLVNASYPMWKQLEQETGFTILSQVGALHISFDKDNGDKPWGTLDSGDSVKWRSLSRRQLIEAYPALKNLPPDTHAVLEPNGGILHADKALIAYMKSFTEHGGLYKDNEKVLQIEPGEIVRIVTQKNIYKAKSVILALGPWAPPFLKNLDLHLPLEPQRIDVLYWKVKNRDMYTPDKMPTIRFLTAIQYNQGKHNVYSLPCLEYPDLLKLCVHVGPKVSPDDRDKTWSDEGVQIAAAFIDKHLNELENKPTITDKCFYTLAPDKVAVLDKHPLWSNIVFAAGFSGSGFKMAPAVGAVLADMAVGDQTNRDVSAFSIEQCRLRHKSSSKL